jgi:hypothetical protein
MSLGVRAYTMEKDVSISKYDDIQRARTLPFFRYAAGRRERLDDVCEIIGICSNRRRGKIPAEVLKLIVKMHAEGKTAGEITAELWYRYGIARTPNSIYSLLKRVERMKGSSTGDELLP